MVLINGNLPQQSGGKQSGKSLCKCDGQGGLSTHVVEGHPLLNPFKSGE